MAHSMATREEHPMPARAMHGAHLLSMVVLIASGIYINSPYFRGGMQTARTLHFIFMFVLIGVAILRIYWAFAGAGSAAAGQRELIRDFRFFGPQRENRGTLGGTVKYYLFLRPEAPTVHKYNGLQKATYVFWLVLIVLQAITGFAMWTPTMSFFEPFTYALGGPIYIRSYHYLIMWLFIYTSAIHIYLSALHADQLRLMFTGREMAPAEERRR